MLNLKPKIVSYHEISIFNLFASSLTPIGFMMTEHLMSSKGDNVLICSFDISLPGRKQTLTLDVVFVSKLIQQL